MSLYWVSGMGDHLRIAWGITGAGHLLKDSYETMKELKKDGHSITTFVSRAGEEVSRMYGLLESTKEISDGSYLNEIYLDSNQGSSFPKIGRFNVGRYDVFILMPATSNTVAKIVYGIADTLVTNCAAQAMKGGIPSLIVPVDWESGVMSEMPYTIDRSKCKSCEPCPPRESCPNEAITDQIDLLKCQGCGICVDMCEYGAISGGGAVPLNIRKIDARNTKMLTEMEGVSVYQEPKDILAKIRNWDY
ncbi:MAG TPA: dihydromethanopterin reductase (acceptor) [Methanocella sp.]|uniref:dihydromethanopterin reductase (acceptor) n=1 Tax=Methanocella sp. TaxID=2052833 RepID=UPI002B88BF98|nr:dihydromethanopterin reductase (acceptor) [Methanocella sp.]HTY91861.1 dihydromethanopterin reductase (acceptor) [Methanocella sp.]